MESGPTLIVMAAGMGSRYGGLKQMDPVGPHGEFIIDYSVYDAIRAGFRKAVFLIRKEFEELFRERIGRRVEPRIETDYVYQSVEDIPAGNEIPPGRVKPWGTGHAVLRCRDTVNAPFGVINADDYYGPSSFRVLRNFLDPAGGHDGEYGLVGFRLENTLTENGPVARGICSIDEDGFLREIHERTRIQRFVEDARFTEDGETWVAIPEGSIVSMNMWGFTPDIFPELETGFSRFLRANPDKILQAEYYLPSAVGELVSAGKARVRVLASGDKWHGMTYPGDKPAVRRAIGRLIGQGIYPEDLWGKLDGSAAE